MPTNYKRFHAILSTCEGVGNPDPIFDIFKRGRSQVRFRRFVYLRKCGKISKV